MFITTTLHFQHAHAGSYFLACKFSLKTRVRQFSVKIRVHFISNTHMAPKMRTRTPDGQAQAACHFA